MKKIVVIAPANSIVGQKDINLIEIGAEKLKKIGFDITFQKNIYSGDYYEYSSTIEQKIADIYTIDELNTDIVLCATGGINSNSILEHLDESIIKNKFDKLILIGNSNNTILLNYISSICNCRCYLGANLKSLGKYDSNLSIKNYQEKINSNNLAIIFENEFNVYNEGQVIGKTFGGNGTALRRLAGTKYFPNFKEKIMVLEFNSKENSPAEVESVLSQYQQMGIFDNISGLILGEYSDEIKILDLIKPYIKNAKYPIIVSKDFGHNVDSTFIPIGKTININTYNKEIKEVKY